MDEINLKNISFETCYSELGSESFEAIKKTCLFLALLVPESIMMLWDRKNVFHFGIYK